MHIIWFEVDQIEVYINKYEHTLRERVCNNSVHILLDELNPLGRDPDALTLFGTWRPLGSE